MSIYFTRKAFLQDYKYSTPLYLSMVINLVEKHLENSKFAKETKSLCLELQRLFDIPLPKYPNEVPILQTGLWRVYNLCLLIPKHPNLESIRDFLLPAIVDMISETIGQFELAPVYNQNPNDMANYNTRSRFIKYKENLLKYIEYIEEPTTQLEYVIKRGKNPDGKGRPSANPRPY